jgi:pre-mRNA-splicing factor 38A
MSDKNFMQLVDKTTRNRVFNSRYWKEECFALNAETIIDKAIVLKYIGGLYSGAKKPTKFLCLFLKMLQMNLPKDIVIEYLKAR